MIVRNITIENFQSYFGVVSIDFSEGMNIVIGNGGKGKSKLFNAFYWVLFREIYLTSIGWCETDKLPRSSEFTMQRHGFINEKALYETEVGESVVCRVILELIVNGMSYIIERSVTAERRDEPDWTENSAWNVPDNTVKVIFDESKGTKTLIGELAENKIAQLFPLGIRNYIWFQGESINSLIDFRKKENLRDAVKHISYYPHYEKLTSIIALAKTTIEKLEQKKLKEANKKNDSVKALLSRLELLRYNLEKEQKNKKDLEGRITMVQIALAEDEGKVSGLATFTKLVKEYDDCDTEIKVILKELDEQDKMQRELLPSLWILRGIDGMIEEADRIISAHVEEESTAPEKKYLDNPSRAKLEEILHSKKCFVCGSDVDEAHPKAVEYILNRIKLQEEYFREMEEYTNNLQQSKAFNLFVGKIQDYPETLLRSLKDIDKQYNEIEDRIEKLRSKLRKANEKKAKLDIEMENVKKKHGVDPRKQASDVQTFTGNIRASRSNLERLQRQMKACDDTIAEYKGDIRALERELKGESSAPGVVTKVDETEWKNISTFLEDVCKRVQEKARVELLEKLETGANDFYRRVTDHDHGYRGKVEIGKDYSITFDPGLNTSHEQRKKMSIINTLLALNQKAMGFSYPFITDAPTSDFDQATTHNYIMGMKDVFEQTIIITKDVVVGSQYYEELYNQKEVSRIHLLNSRIYIPEGKEPEKHEVSTIVERLK